jgi:hypothetical protein
LIFIFALSFIVTGCEKDKEVINWHVNPSFKAGDLTLYGNKDKVDFYIEDKFFDTIIVDAKNKI